MIGDKILFDSDICSKNKVKREKIEFVFGDGLIVPKIEEIELRNFSLHGQLQCHWFSLWGEKNPKIHIYLHLNM